MHMCLGSSNPRKTKWFSREFKHSKVKIGTCTEIWSLKPKICTANFCKRERLKFSNSWIWNSNRTTWLTRKLCRIKPLLSRLWIMTWRWLRNLIGETWQSRGRKLKKFFWSKKNWKLRSSLRCGAFWGWRPRWYRKLGCKRIHLCWTWSMSSMALRSIIWSRRLNTTKFMKTKISNWWSNNNSLPLRNSSSSKGQPSS